MNLSVYKILSIQIDGALQQFIKTCDIFFDPNYQINNINNVKPKIRQPNHITVKRGTFRKVKVSSKIPKKICNPKFKNVRLRIFFNKIKCTFHLGSKNIFNQT